MGWVSTFLSKAVIAGFVLGFSMGIVIDQSHKLLGVPAPSDSGTLLIGALALVFVGYSESLAAARSMAVKHGYDIDPNQELIAQGMSCGTAGLVGGFSVDGSLSKTSVADSAGQESQMASLLNAVLVLMTLLFLASIFQNLPSATLGVWSKPHVRAHGCSSLRCDSDSPEPAHRVAQPMDENEGCASVSVVAAAERAAMVVLTNASASRQPKNVSLPAGGPVLGCFVTRCPPASMAGTR